MTPIPASIAPPMVLAEIHVGLWAFVFGTVVLVVAAIQAFLLRRAIRQGGPRLVTTTVHWLFLTAGVCWFISGAAMLLVADSPDTMWLPMMLAGLLLIGVMAFWLPLLHRRPHV